VNNESPNIASASLTTVAVYGSILNTGQWVVNKLATAAAMVLIAHLLLPKEYGVAIQALAIAQFLVVLTPISIGDVLIAHPRRLKALVPSAQALAMRIGLSMTALVLVSIPVAVIVYSKYPAAALGGLLAVLALRPVFDALTVVGVSQLRVRLSYRRIALVDGFVQLSMTALSLLMAALGGGGSSLVVPQVAGTLIRSQAYRRDGHTSSTTKSRIHRSAIRALWRLFLPAALAQYVHNVVVLLEVLVLGVLAGELQTGLFGFAFMLAAQANSVIAYQLGVVLQPIFGRMQDDPQRQAAGFLRAQRVLAAVCIPLSVTQAVIAQPLFRLLFDETWLPAVPVFQAISVGQTFYFASSASIACLRAQRRFVTFFRWQCIQGILSLPTYAFGAWCGGALGVAIASGIAWSIGSPLGVWLCLRPAGAGGVGTALMLFIRPWLASGLPAIGGLLVIRSLVSSGTNGDIASILVVAPLVFLTSAGLACVLDREVRTTLSPRARSIMARFRRA
jgi:O-antigen/teichoic acid export membrane protein